MSRLLIPEEDIYWPYVFTLVFKMSDLGTLNTYVYKGVKEHKTYTLFESQKMLQQNSHKMICHPIKIFTCRNFFFWNRISSTYNKLNQFTTLWILDQYKHLLSTVFLPTKPGSSNKKIIQQTLTYSYNTTTLE